jgi:cytochrome P450
MTAPLPPLVPGMPLIGNLPDLIRDYPKLLTETAPKFNPVTRIKALGVEMTVVSDPDLLTTILRDDHKKYARGGEGAASLKRVIGNGLIALEGSEWLIERRLMQPYFHRSYLPRLVELMAETLDEQLDNWDALADGETVVDMARLMKRLTLTVFTKAMYSMGIPDEDIDALADAIETSMRLNSSRMNLEQMWPSFLPLPGEQTINDSVALFDKAVEEIIQARRDSGSDDNDLLGLLMQSTDEDDNSLSPQQLHDEVKTLIIGGYDTTSGSLMWALYLLHQNPEYVARIIEEAQTIQGDYTMENIGKLTLTRHIVDETLRLHPVSWANNRVCVEDDELGGYHIPKGTMIMIPIRYLHRNPEHWDKPNDFYPERWQEKHGGARHRFAYMPFGMGPRVCLGQHFSLLESTMALAKIYERYEIKPVSDHPENVTFEFTMAPVEMPVRIKRREPVAVSS